MHLKPFFGTLPMQRISPEIANNFVQHLIKLDLKPKTIKHICSTAYNVFRMAQEEDLITRNPMEKAWGIPKNVDRAAKSFLTPEEIKTLLDYASQFKTENTLKGRMYYLIKLALATGARRGELLALKTSLIDYINNMITFKDNLTVAEGVPVFSSPKTKKGDRKISVDKGLLNELHALENPSGYIFTNSLGSYIPPTSVYAVFATMLKKAGVTPIRFHDLRHTHATLLIANGINMKTVSARMGHKDIQTTMNLYAHAMLEKDEEAANIIGKLF